MVIVLRRLITKMQPSKSDLQKLIKTGILFISSIPKKHNFMESERNLSSSKLKNQLNILRVDFDVRRKTAFKNYDQWYTQCLRILEGIDQEVAKKFQLSKGSLDLEKRVKDGIKILEKFLAIKSPTRSKLNDIIKNGENDHVEFKSSLRWDFNRDELNKALEIPVLKTIVAFLNSEGGTLLVGVDDRAQVIGVEKDYPTFKKHNADGFIQYLLQIVNFRIGTEMNKFISIIVEKIDEKEVCVIRVEKSGKPSFLKLENKEEFYIRASLSSQPMNIREASEYIRMHWKQ